MNCCRRTLLLLICLLLTQAGVSAVPAWSGPADLVPAPVAYTLQEGVLPRAASARVVVARRPSKAFRRRVADLPAFAREEAYRLSVGHRRITIEALTPTGVCRARATLRQLLLLSGDDADASLPCCTIEDYPRFQHRGLMIDESRTFKGKEFILKQLDAMYLLRMNTLHLHLTDAAGWRIAIPAYPRLTDSTAWRIGDAYHAWEANGYPFAGADVPGAYGGYYTREDLEDIVAYAARYAIRVIPEIEMPGHSMEVNRAYPEVACVGEDGRPRPFSWDLCPGNEGTFRLLEAVIDEVTDIFPSPLIHIGGDEAVMKDWPLCVNCRRRMETEGLSSVRDLQGYLVRRMEAYIRSKGRTVIGWDEIVDTGLPEGALVQSWRGTKGGVKAIAAGHDVVMSPYSHCYLDYYQDLIRKEPPAVGHLQSLRHVYSFDPVEGLDADAAVHVRGLQGNLWCELVQTPSHAEYMLYPRAFALAEIGWTPQDQRDFFPFRARCLRLLDVWHRLGYHTFDLAGESPRAQSDEPPMIDPS